MILLRKVPSVWNIIQIFFIIIIIFFFGKREERGGGVWKREMGRGEDCEFVMTR